MNDFFILLSLLPEGDAYIVVWVLNKLQTDLEHVHSGRVIGPHIYVTKQLSEAMHNTCKW